MPLWNGALAYPLLLVSVVNAYVCPVCVQALDFDRPMLAGRTIQALTKALEDCQAFEAIATRCVGRQYSVFPIKLTR